MDTENAYTIDRQSDQRQVTPVDLKPDWAVQNRGVKPHFFTELISFVNADGETVEVNEERVRIVCAGDQLTEHCTIVDDQIRERFAIEYQDFKLGREALKGTPLEGWGGLQPRVLRDLQDLHCETIEDLAAISDGNITRIINGRVLREQAIDYLRKKPKRAPSLPLCVPKTN